MHLVNSSYFDNTKRHIYILFRYLYRWREGKTILVSRIKWLIWVTICMLHHEINRDLNSRCYNIILIGGTGLKFICSTCRQGKKYIRISIFIYYLPVEYIKFNISVICHYFKFAYSLHIKALNVIIILDKKN